MSDGVSVVVDVRSPRWTRAMADPGAVCRAAAGAALDIALYPGGEVSIVLADDGFMRTLNRDHRGMDSATNVLAFPLDPGLPGAGGDDGPHLLGDVVVAYETTAREAAAFGRPLSDRLAHLVVHASLHLIGYRHDGPADAEAMERIEAEALARLGIADPFTVPAAGA